MSIPPCGSAGSALAAALLALSMAAGAAEVPAMRLLMVDAEDCPYCEAWQEEVGVVYPRTPEGRLAPLRQVVLGDPLPPGVRLREPVRYTPTFVLLDALGRETGRITGYPGEEHFWGLLQVLLQRNSQETARTGPR